MRCSPSDFLVRRRQRNEGAALARLFLFQLPCLPINDSAKCCGSYQVRPPHLVGLSHLNKRGSNTNSAWRTTTFCFNELSSPEGQKYKSPSGIQD